MSWKAGYQLIPVGRAERIPEGVVAALAGSPTKTSGHEQELKIEIVVERIAYSSARIEMEVVNLESATAIVSSGVDVILLRLATGEAQLK